LGFYTTGSGEKIKTIPLSRIFSSREIKQDFHAYPVTHTGSAYTQSIGARLGMTAQIRTR